ncbi:MAG: hypothetical protein MHM6MM_008365 [Cercozoa sp. M6MM]
MGLKVVRQKRVRRILRQYKDSLGVEPPFAVLVGPLFCHQALEQRLNIREQVTKLLELPSEQCTFYTHRSFCEMLRHHGPHYRGALQIAQSFEMAPDAHTDTSEDTHGGDAVAATRAEICTAVPALVSAPLCDNNNNNNNDNNNESVRKSWIICAQMSELRAAARRAGVPLILAHGRTPTLEAPSKGFARKLRHQQQQRLQAARESKKREKRAFRLISRELGVEAGPAQALPKQKRQKRRVAAAPNPLSMRKKKVVGDSTDATAKRPTGQRRRRRQKRPARHRWLLDRRRQSDSSVTVATAASS